MSKPRICIAAAVALAGTLLLPTSTTASVVRAPSPPDSIQLTADNGTTVSVSAAKRVAGDDGTHYLGQIVVDKVEPPHEEMYPADIVIWFDFDSDEVPDLTMATSATSDHVYSHRVTGWDDPAPVDVTNRGCFDGGVWSSDDRLEVTYDSTCLDASGSMRVSAVMVTNTQTFPIGGLRAWSEPVGTPSYAWRYCERLVDELYAGSGSRVLLHYTAVSKISCTKGATLLRKAHRSFRKDEREKIRIGKFTCTFPNMISAQVDCKHRKNRKRWAYSWSMP